MNRIIRVALLFLIAVTASEASFAIEVLCGNMQNPSSPFTLTVGCMTYFTVAERDTWDSMRHTLNVWEPKEIYGNNDAVLDQNLPMPAKIWIVNPYSGLWRYSGFSILHSGTTYGPHGRHATSSSL